MPTATAPGIIGGGARAPAPGRAALRCRGRRGRCRAPASPRSRPGRGCRRRAAIGRSTAARIALTAAPLTDRPAKAPLRSTTCSQAKPASANAAPARRGPSLNTVALAISPRTRRTQAPSLRSIAGYRITAPPGSLLEQLVVIMARHDPAARPAHRPGGCPSAGSPDSRIARWPRAGCRAGRG